VSYDIDVLPLAPGQDLAEAAEALAELEAPPTPEEAALRDRLAGRLTGAGLGFEVVHTDEAGELQLDNGTVLVDLSGRSAALNFPYWGSTDRDALADSVFGVLAILREEAGWRAYDPQLGAELRPADREEMIRMFDRGAGIVDEMTAEPERSLWDRIRGRG
jgi:hypothetical protein